MILEEETFEAFRYYPSELKPKSGKPILAACELCGKFRKLTKHDYRTFCLSCSHRFGEKMKGDKHYNYGKHRIEEHKAKMSAALKGKHLTEDHKANISKNHADNKGDKNGMWNGGKKAAHARANAKRKRQLGYMLLMPLKEGEVGHHVTNEHVIGIPADVHQSIGGRRRKHRTKVLQWLKVNDKKKYDLVVAVLANMSWFYRLQFEQNRKLYIPSRYTCY